MTDDTTYYRIARILLRLPEAGTKEITKLAKRHRCHVSSNLALLERQGFASYYIAMKENRRLSKYWSLTDSGKAFFRQKHKALTHKDRLALLDALLNEAWRFPEKAIIRALQLHRRNPHPKERIEMKELQKLFDGMTIHGVYHALEQLRNYGLIESRSHFGAGGGYRFTRISLPPAGWKRPGQ